MSNIERTSFSGIEHVLNHAAQRFQLTRPSKVGPVMELIRQCEPKTYEDWAYFFWNNSFTKTKEPIKVTKEVINELGGRLYDKIRAVVIPEWTAAFERITLEDCVAYIHEVTLYRTYDGYIREKSVVNDNLAHKFPEIEFSESDSDLDHSGDVDFIGYVKKKNISIGLQIKPKTASFSFANYSVSDRMKRNFESFKRKYGGDVFVIFSDHERIMNPEVLNKIKSAIS